MDNELFELCKEVYKRFPEWSDLRDWWWGNHIKGGGIIYDFTPNAPKDKIGSDDVPVYTSDYLLEKLPRKVRNESLELFAFDDHFEAEYSMWNERIGSHIADTPLKALLKLTIALSEAGELK